MITFGDAQWDAKDRRLTVRGERVKLSWRFAECLSILVEAGGSVVTKEQLQQQIWNGAMVEESNLAQCITALRKALDPAPDGGSYIETVPRVGYRMAVAIHRPAAEPPQRARRAIPRYAYVGGFLVLALSGFALQRVSAHYANLEQARELTMRGLAIVRTGNQAEGTKAAPVFQQALELVPDYPLALAGVAEGTARYGRTYFGGAIELAAKAVELDPSCDECQAILGFILMTRDWKWKEGGQHLARSIELDPGQFTRRIWYANWQMTQNRLEEAEGQIQAAIRIDSSKPQAHSLLCAVHYLSGKYREAVRVCDKAVSMDHRHQPGHYWMSRAYMALGEDVSAMMAHANMVGAWSQWSEQRIAEFAEEFQRAYAKGGRKGIAHYWIDEVGQEKPRDVHRYNRAVWFAWIGEYDAALAELEAGVESRPYHIIFTAVDPVFAPLRSEPRFREVLRKVGLVG